MESAGYTRLLERHGVASPALRHASWISATVGKRQALPIDLGVEESFPPSYRPADTDYDHLVFALKYDGLDLAALARIFAAIDRHELEARLREQPQSKYARRLFFLFERLTGSTLDLADVAPVAYVGVLDPDEHYTARGSRSARHRVVDNLLGELGGFCPLVRRTSRLDESSAKRLDQRARAITANVEPAMLARAIHFLHGKETRSSFAIEREEVGDKEERFVAQLARVAALELDTEEGLTQLQHAIVDPRYRDAGFRSPGDLEVYVSETVGYNRERIHHIGARSSSTRTLMQSWARMRSVEGPGAAVVEAACRAFAFVFIHPFGDGNGRIHRLLFHHVLARRGFLPDELIVPISSAILADLRRYDAVLEDFSRRVLPRIEHRLDADGRLTIVGDPDDFYRYPDLTVQCEATFDWLDQAIERDLLHELDFLRRHDEVRRAMQRIVDMPDRRQKLLIVLCLQNHGRLAKRKREQFPELSDEILARLEAIVQAGFADYEGPLL
ncbi:Fic family protein [Nannocystaceae bacterium ST9]